MANVAQTACRLSGAAAGISDSQRKSEKSRKSESTTPTLSANLRSPSASYG